MKNMTRIEKFREAFADKADAALITCPLNCRYLSGVDYTDGFLLITKENAYLFADSRYIEVAKRDAFADFEVMLLSGRRSSLIKALLKEGSVIGYEDNIMTCAELSSYKEAMPQYKFAPTGEVTEKLRNVKDTFEKESIIKAQRIAEAAFEHVLGILTPEITERQVALELDYFMRKNGSEGLAFDTIAVSGANSSLPHGVPTDKKLGYGFLTMDFGARANGYCSDMTRTVCIGKPDAEMERLYNTVLLAQCKALDVIRAGIKCSDADKVAREIIDGSGYKGLFGHSLGHGVGLYIHEDIHVSPRSEQVLEKGNVVTVEPGIYVEGKYGVRIEDMVYVTENGCENLTRSEKKLIVV